MNRIKVVLACALASVGSANAEVLLVPQNTNMTNSLGGGSCAPACASTHQEMLSSELFSGPVMITGISLYVLNPYAHSWAPMDLKLMIGATSVSLADMTSTLSSNVSGSLTEFANLQVAGTPKAVDSLTFTNLSGFLYDPSEGNLMMEIRNSAPRSTNTSGPGFQVIYSNGTQSREAYQLSPNTSSVTGMGDSIRYSVIYTPAVPEPSTLWMALLGVAGFSVIARRRSS